MTDFDAIVVGAGAAGIAATRALVGAGRSAVCLEASGRVGGRAHTDTEMFGVPFDVGAHWMHCEHVNALKAPGLAMGLDLFPASEADCVAGLEDSNVLWDPVDTAFARAVQAVGGLQDGADLSLADVFYAEGPWALTVQMSCCLSMARDLHQISLRDMMTWEGGDDWFCREGFGHLVARLAGGLPIRLSTPVTDIQAGTDHVRVVTPAGLLTARAVIVTASVGVLAEDVIRFDPPLDSDRRRAFDQITMSDYGHTALMFKPGAIPLEQDTWLTYQITEAVDGIPQGGGFLCNIAGTGLTCFEAGGSFSRALQDGAAADAIDHALGTLVEIFGTDLRKQFVKGYRTNWRHEPYVRGAYSGALPGGSGQREVLRRPHADHIHFAGEATSRGQQASVSGAYLEGQRAAADVLAGLA